MRAYVMASLVGAALMPAVALAQAPTSSQSGPTPSAPNLGTPQAQTNMGQEPPNVQVHPVAPAAGQTPTVPTPTLSQPNTPVRQ